MPGEAALVAMTPKETVAFSSSQTAKPHPETALKLDRGSSVRMASSHVPTTQDAATKTTVTRVC